MRQAMRLIPFVLVGLGLAGCSDESTARSQVPQAPHHGTILSLPDGLGCAELVNEPESDGRGDTPTALVVYFLTPDGKAAMTPPPSEVKAKVSMAQSRQGKQETLDLKPEPKSGDPAGESRFASKSGPYALTTIRGELSGKAKDKPFTLEFAGGR
jgi:hypothetical protein